MHADMVRERSSEFYSLILREQQEAGSHWLDLSIYETSK